jgi:flagellar assembly protein FliH
MGAPAKFLFDLDFAEPEGTRERAATKTEIAQQIAEAEARGYRAGFDAARLEAKAESDRRLALAMEQIAVSIGAIAGRFAAIESRMETEAVDVALAAARKLCAELVAAEPLTNIMALVGDCFRHLTATPHLVVRVSDALYDAARERVEQLAKRSGFEGRLVILAEPDIADGDCRIEWADGGVTLDRAAIDAKISELVGRYMASRNQAGLSGHEVTP